MCLWEKHAVFDKTFISFPSPFFPSVFTRFLIPLYFNLEQKKKATRVIGLISIIYPLKIDRIKGETYLFPPFVFPFNWNGITNFPNNYSIIISPLSCFIIISSSLAVVHPSFDLYNPLLFWLCTHYETMVQLYIKNTKFFHRHFIQIYSHVFRRK